MDSKWWWLRLTNFGGEFLASKNPPNWCTMHIHWGWALHKHDKSGSFALCIQWVSTCSGPAHDLLAAWVNSVKWTSSKEQCTIYRKYYRYLHQMNAIVFIILSAIIWARFYFSSTTTCQVGLFDYVIYSSAYAHCWETIDRTSLSTCSPPPLDSPQVSRGQEVKNQ